MKMKTKLQTFLRATLLLAAILATAIPSHAYDFEVNGIYYHFNGDGTSVYVTYKAAYYNSYSGSVTIPSSVTYNGKTYSVTAIGDMAFYFSSVASVTIPNSVTYIGGSAFRDCTGLTSLTIPTNVTSIGNYAFDGCNNVTKLTWNAKDCSSNGNMATSNITQVTIGLGVEVLPDYFVSGSKIAGLSIPSTVKRIGAYAFNGCVGLTNIYIPTSITTIGNNAFEGCVGLTNIYFPNTVSSIGGYAFNNCTGLTSVTISLNVSSIGGNAFHGCNNVNKLVWNAKNCSSNGNMTTSNITQVTIGSGVEVLPNNFVSCSKITTVSIPNSVTSIYDNAFSSCTRLTSVSIGNSVQTIGYTAFSGCTGLTSVTFPNSVTTISSYAFSGCTNLNTISLPNSVFYIYNGVFSGCTKLAKVYCRAIMPPVMGNSDMFDAVTYQNAILYVPDLTYGYYIQTNPWNLFHEIKTESYSDGGVVFNSSIYPTSVKLQDASQTVNSYFTFEGQRYNTTLLVTGLEPNHIYSATYTKGGVETPLKFYTSDLMMVPEGGTMLNETTVMLKAETNMADEETICGFDWRRYDGPDDYLGTRVYCPVYDGQMAGTLKNLTRDTFYKFRPFYKSNNGTVYYGDWVTFYTADAGVEFDPVVYTYNSPAVTKTEATLQGVALRGSDAITQQGFEYRKATSSSRTKVTATGERMSKTVTGLQPGTKYKFRAFVTAGGKTTYGEEVEFTTLTNVTSGDANGDGVVNISDVTALISYVLNGSGSGLNLSNADLNGDGVVNISDVTALISQVVNGN